MGKINPIDSLLPGATALGLFKKRKGPKAPQLEDPEIAAAKAREEMEARRRKGRQATILTGPSGSESPSVLTTTLLGQATRTG